MYSDVQISKNGLQLKLKLHQLWRIAMWLSHDCLWILTASCFSGDNVSLWTGVCSSSLGDNFWISLTALWLFCYSHFVIRQDHGFGSPRKTPISCRFGFLLSCFYKSNSSYLFCSSYMYFWYIILFQISFRISAEHYSLSEELHAPPMGPESRSCTLPLGRPVSRKAVKYYLKLCRVVIVAGAFLTDVDNFHGRANQSFVLWEQCISSKAWALSVVPHFSLSPPRVAFSCMGWFSHSLYYPWGKMGDHS